MPYSSIAELPDEVRDRYSPRCQRVFMDAYNAAAKDTDDEATRFRIAHAAAGNCKDAGKAELAPVKATVLDDDRFALLAIPFTGPIPNPHAPRGADLDGEWFSERTDIKASWLPVRLVDWHHGNDDTFKRDVIGKADNLRMDEDGWWVDVWLEHGKRRLDLIRRLAEKGAQLFGSSESVAGMVKKAKTGEILQWPYWRQTLSTSPQNTHSVLRPIKAALEDAVTDYSPSPSFWADITAGLDTLGDSLRGPSAQGDLGAKAGRVLSGVNEQALRKALDNLGLTVRELEGVLAKLRKEDDD
jgi:cation transport regulator ChaB